MTTLVEWLNNIMTQKLGLSQGLANMIDGSVAVIALILIAVGVNWICQGIYRWISIHSRRMRTSRWYRFLEQRKLSHNILLIIPGITFYIGVWFLFRKGDPSIIDLHRYCIVYFAFVFIMIINSALLSFLDFYSSSEKNRSHPLKGLVQGLQVILYFIGAIVIISLMINKSPTVLLTGLGASAAVLMLIFKDSILGFVAGVQLSRNNMVRIGDWIQMPDGSANGVVEEITLNTVKVRNWDNTLTMIPPYSLVSAPFKNWRGMQESDGRRVDKCIYVDINSINSCSDEMIAAIIKAFPILENFFTDRKGTPVTNIEIYRTYIEEYLRQHPEVNAGLDLIITQKEATAYGVPVEVYFFIKDKAWASYERKQSDIFGYLMCIAPEFGLRLYQRP